MRMKTILLTFVASTALTAPAMAEMALTPFAAPAMSPLSLIGLSAVIAVAGIRIIRNRRRR